MNFTPMGTERRLAYLAWSDVVFSCVYKVYVGFSCRRFSSDLEDARERGLIGRDRAPHFNSVSKYLSDPDLTPVFKKLVAASSYPLAAVEEDFAVDSSGFSTSRFVRWFNKKHRRVLDNREWVKLHLMCGVNTKIVTAADVSGWTAHDTNYFARLIGDTAERFEIREVSADKAYLSHKNLDAVDAAGGTPYIPFKSNTLEPVELPEESVWSKMYHLYSYKREDFLAHYHKRSNIESAFSMMKGKFGDSLRSKSDAGQINEALCKVLCHNICVLIRSARELGVEPVFLAELGLVQETKEQKPRDD